MPTDSTIRAPQMLLPRPGTDLSRFAVIACDQFTSQIEYWQQLDQYVGAAPSTLRMILPEVYLPFVDQPTEITKINATINHYLHADVFTDLGPGFILVERTLSAGTKRLGLMVAIDLEAYSFNPGAHTPIRASEATIIERLPPRLKIREHAALEVPHTLVLFDDPEQTIIEQLYQKRMQFPVVYDFELNQNGGHLRGYHIKDTVQILDAFAKLQAANADNLLFIVGDGNHSLATAKAHWNLLKVHLSPTQQATHPARYALVEAINLYNHGLQIEPIHRLVFDVTDDFIPGLQTVLSGGYSSKLFTQARGEIPQTMPEERPQVYQIVQQYIDQYLHTHPKASVDYIHGIEHLHELAINHPGSVGIVMPPLTRADIVKIITTGAVLPRKSFSLGHAREKRYYLECQKII